MRKSVRAFFFLFFCQIQFQIASSCERRDDAATIMYVCTMYMLQHQLHRQQQQQQQ